MLYAHFMETVEVSKRVRRIILEMANRSRSPHIGPCLSVVDILVVLYFKVLRVNPLDPNWKERDIFILSKGHAAMALYAVLSEKGFFGKDLLLGYYKDTLPAHLDRLTAPGIEVSAGSLGHGMPIGIGMAYAIKLKNEKRRVFVLIGDGESQEGSIWEGAMLAPKLGLDNLTVILDHNDLQGYGRPSELVQYYPIDKKWESFGWDAEIVDGHDHEELFRAFTKKTQRPRIVICKTVKGKGVSFMENQLKWHYFIVTDEILEEALKELS